LCKLLEITGKIYDKKWYLKVKSGGGCFGEKAFGF
jgi:hypothetical protein